MSGTPADARRFTAELAPQDDPAIGAEIIRVRFEDGDTEQLRLHDYDRLYALPGVYEQIVQERLGCRSPQQLAEMLAGVVDGLGWERPDARVLDIGAGNGVSGEALAAQGLHPVLGTDIVPAAREAALRDRPGLYDEYRTLDLLDVGPDARAQLVGLRANVLSCVAPVGDHTSQLPPAALAAAAALLTPDALVAYMHDPMLGVPDPITAEFWRTALGPRLDAKELARARYLHRYTVNGQPFEMIGVVWRLRRDDQAQ
ncbi:MAG TPA: hypothetical protein VIK04_13400 [Solirubrobacteraceae bacterium]